MIAVGSMIALDASSVAEADAPVAGDQLAAQVQRHRLLDGMLGGGDDRRDSVSRERIGRPLSDAAAKHRAATLQELHKTPVVAAGIRSPFPNRPGSHLAVPDLQDHEGGAPRQMFAHRNSIACADSNSH